MTQHERKLWHMFLKSYPIRFQRQKAIDHFIVDFYCHQAKLAIEIDGSQHFEEQGVTYDAERTAILNSYGLQVLRFTNRDINNEFTAVCEEIHNTVKKRIGCDPYDQL